MIGARQVCNAGVIGGLSKDDVKVTRRVSSGWTYINLDCEMSEVDIKVIGRKSTRVDCRKSTIELDIEHYKDAFSE